MTCLSALRVLSKAHSTRSLQRTSCGTVSPCRALSSSSSSSSASSPVGSSTNEQPDFPPRVVSGIQPTGIPHLGNYCGAIVKWVRLQNEAQQQQQKHQKQPKSKRHDLIFNVVDLHAITVAYDATKMQQQIKATVATMLAAGLDPKHCIIFKQSDVLFHADLAWRLGCITPIGWLNRMTQYKQKSQNHKMESSLGLLAYPVLMAADVLLYKATHIPVGEDQQQHLELARMIATTFNDKFNCVVFPRPYPLVENADAPLARIMSLRNPTKKMSKSDPSAMSRIDLTDTPDEVQKKIMKAQTDAIAGISFDKVTRPGVSNLLSIMSAAVDRSEEELASQFKEFRTGDFKREVADAVIAKIAPIGNKFKEYEADPMFIDQVLRDGAAQANELAAVTMQEVREVMGM